MARRAKLGKPIAKHFNSFFQFSHLHLGKIQNLKLEQLLKLIQEHSQSKEKTFTSSEVDYDVQRFIERALPKVNSYDEKILTIWSTFPNRIFKKEESNPSTT